MHFLHHRVSYVAAALIVALVAIGSYGWLLRTVLDLRTSIADDVRSVAAEAQTEERARTAKRLLEETKMERTELNRRFVTEDSIVSFIETVESLGHTTGASVTVASVETAESKSSVLPKVLRIRFIVSGTWEGVTHVLALAEALPYVLEIIDVDLERADISSDTWSASVVLQVAMAQ